MQRSLAGFGFVKMKESADAQNSNSNCNEPASVSQRFNALSPKSKNTLKTVSYDKALFTFAATQMHFSTEEIDDVANIAAKYNGSDEPPVAAQQQPEIIERLILCNTRPKILHKSLKWPYAMQVTETIKEKRRFLYILSTEAPTNVAVNVISTAEHKLKLFTKSVQGLEKEFAQQPSLKALDHIETQYKSIETYIKTLETGKDQNKHKKFDVLLNNINRATAIIQFALKKCSKTKAEFTAWICHQLKICVTTKGDVVPKRTNLKTKNGLESVIASPALWGYVEPIKKHINVIETKLKRQQRSVEEYSVERCCRVSKLSGKKSASERLKAANDRNTRKATKRTKKRKKENEKKRKFSGSNEHEPPPKKLKRSDKEENDDEDENDDLKNDD